MAPKRLIFFPIMALLVVGLCARETSALKLLITIPLPGVTGRFDHFALDIKGNCLFVATLGRNTLEAMDLTAGKRIQNIPGLGKPTGVLLLPDLNRLFVAGGDDGNVRVFDADTLRLLKTISGLEDADNMRFDAKAGLIYVGYGSGALAVIDAAKTETIGHFKLAAHPESFQLEKNDGWIFVNVPDAQHIAVVDRGRCLTRKPDGAGNYRPSGVYGDSTLATKEKGRIIVEATVSEVVRQIRELTALK